MVIMVIMVIKAIMDYDGNGLWLLWSLCFFWLV
jgi:hypothetical protein